MKVDFGSVRSVKYDFQIRNIIKLASFKLKKNFNRSGMLAEALVVI